MGDGAATTGPESGGGITTGSEAKRTGCQNFEGGFRVKAEGFTQGLTGFGANAGGAIELNVTLGRQVIGPGLSFARDLGSPAALGDGFAVGTGVGAIGSGEAVLPKGGLDFGDFKGLGIPAQFLLHGRKQFRSQAV